MTRPTLDENLDSKKQCQRFFSLAFSIVYAIMSQVKPCYYG